jgi:hypothetical protein
MFTELAVHFSAISGKLPYIVFRHSPDRKFWHFSAYLSDKIEKSPSLMPKMFSSRPSVTRQREHSVEMLQYPDPSNSTAKQEQTRLHQHRSGSITDRVQFGRSTVRI